MLLEALTYDNRIFGLDAQLLFQMCFQILAIFILFLLGSYLLLDPVRKILNDRKERVARQQREAEEDRMQALRYKEEYDGKMKEIDRISEDILRESRRKALDRENEIIAAARAEAGEIIENARQEAERQKLKVQDEMKQEIISVAALLSEKMIGVSMDRRKQDELFEQTLKEIGDDTWLSR